MQKKYISKKNMLGCKKPGFTPDMFLSLLGGVYVRN